MLLSPSRPPSTLNAPALHLSLRLLLAALVASSALLVVPRATLAADITLEAAAMLGGHVRPGAWAAVRVELSNDGPEVAGELRVRTAQQGVSRFNTTVHLPNGARQQHMLYVKPALFGARLVVELVSGETVLASQEVPIKSHDSQTSIVAIVAERPEGFARDVGEALRNPNFAAEPSVITLTAADLPWRVEAWAAMDRLVWQDVDFGQLNEDQLKALRLWVSTGGRLVIVGGTAGVTGLADAPSELLPFTPERTIDVAPAELSALLGSLPAGATTAPAIAGTLQRGSVLGRSGDSVYAAQTTYGQGGVTIIGLDPAMHWLAGTDAAGSLWRRALPLSGGASGSPFIVDEFVFQNALYNLPAVALPPIDQLFVLLLAYIALIGPVNYLVLRRIDRREWAWVTMPALVAVFAVGSYGLGAALKGSDVIVNQVAIVRAGESTESGIGQVYVGVFSPSRRSFDVRIPGGPLLSTPTSQTGGGTTEQAIDAIIGATASRLRNFEVGFGVVRGFRADMATDAPRISADLRLVGGRVVGTLTNHSDTTLEDLGIAFGGGIMVIERLGPGETAEVEIAQQSSAFDFSIADRIFGTRFPSDAEAQRRQVTRRTVVEQITGYGNRVQGAGLEVPVLLAWRTGPAIEVQLAGERPNLVGESLFVVPLDLAYESEALFDDALIVKTIIDNDTGQGWAEGDNLVMDRGTLVVEARPAGLSGTFRATSLELALTLDGVRALRGNGEPIEPLPDAQQPDQEDPVGMSTGSEDDSDDPGEPGKPFEPGGGQGLPALQLYDHAAGRWYEFGPFDQVGSYMLADPGRWVDATGRLLVRLVNRSEVNEPQWFQLLVRMEGTIE